MYRYCENYFLIDPASPFTFHCIIICNGAVLINFMRAIVWRTNLGWLFNIVSLVFAWLLLLLLLTNLNMMLYDGQLIRRIYSKPWLNMILCWRFGFVVELIVFRFVFECFWSRLWGYAKLVVNWNK